MSRGSADEQVAALASRQAGVVDRRQLRAAGLSDAAIDHRVATARLHRLHRGVYAVGHTRLAPLARETAALLAIGRGAVLSHTTAGGLWGLLADDEATVHVTLAGANSRRRRRHGLRVHVVRALAEAERGRRHGLPLTAPARTLLDLAGVLTVSALTRAAEEAQVRRLVSRRAMVSVLQRHPNARGAGRLREMIREEPRLTRSDAERRLVALIRRAGLPAPRSNVRLHGLEVDLVWTEHRLVVEVDGFAFHRSRVAFERDRRRDASLVARGYRVVRLTWRRITDEPERVAIELAGLLAAPT